MGWVSLVVAIAVMLICPVQQQPPVFRGAAVIVPVDVRVLDRNGMPVTDLTAPDFSLKEDGVEQKIVHFAVQRLTADAAVDSNIRRMTSGVSTVQPQNRRIFLIMLGRGRLQEPSKGLDALIRFVGERLLPQDQVAVMAWNRATEFTTDRARIAGVLDRFKTAHEAVEMELQLQFTGLGALYANRKISPALQKRIDGVFGSATPGTREVLYGGRTDDAEASARSTSSALLEHETRQTVRRLGGSDALLGALIGNTTLGASFDDYVGLSRQTLQDVGNLYAGIEYLRFIEGEKHLIYVTEGGFLMPSADSDRDFGRLASDARVALDTLQTGGVYYGEGLHTVGSPQTSFALAGLRTLSETTGGQSSVSQYADRAIDRIVHATEFGYVLGYAPVDTAFDGRFRKIEIAVSRRDVTTAYRRGYFARREPESFDPRRQLATTRLITAAGYKEDIKDLAVKIAARDLPRTQGYAVTVDVTIAADRIRFAPEQGRHFAALSVAVLCADARAQSVGEQWQMAVDISVPDTHIAVLKRDGLKLRLEIPVLRPPHYVKAIAYDYGSDLVGSTFIRMR